MQVSKQNQNYRAAYRQKYHYDFGVFQQKIAENKESIARQSKYENKKYEYLKGIRNNPKRVEVFDPQTDETSIYASKYKAGRALDIYPMYFKDGAILKNRYVITVG